MVNILPTKFSNQFSWWKSQVDENLILILILISLNFVPKYLIDYKSPFFR